MTDTDTDKPEPPVWVGPSAVLDIDALLDRLREREREHDKEQQDGKHLR